MPCSADVGADVAVAPCSFSQPAMVRVVRRRARSPGVQPARRQRGGRPRTNQAEHGYDDAPTAKSSSLPLPRFLALVYAVRRASRSIPRQSCRRRKRSGLGAAMSGDTPRDRRRRTGHPAVRHLDSSVRVPRRSRPDVLGGVDALALHQARSCNFSHALMRARAFGRPPAAAHVAAAADWAARRWRWACDRTAERAHRPRSRSKPCPGSTTCFASGSSFTLIGW